MISFKIEDFAVKMFAILLTICLVPYRGEHFTKSTFCKFVQIAHYTPSIHMCICVCVYIHMCICVCLCVYPHVNMCVSVCISTCAYVCACVCVSIQSIATYIPSLSHAACHVDPRWWRCIQLLCGLRDQENGFMGENNPRVRVQPRSPLL